MDLSLKVNVISAENEAEFHEKYFKKQIPVIIQGLLKGTVAEKNWNLDYMKQKLGKVDVEVYDNNFAKTTAYTKGDLIMKFSDFVEEIKKDEPQTKRMFLFNGFKHCKELSNEFPCPNIFKGYLDKLGYMFFGGKNTEVRIHFDIDMSNVLHTQFDGKKRFFLFSQEYNDLLYKTPLNTYSIADFKAPDYNKFPGLKYLKGYDITLNPGESLFMPSGYWHYIVYQQGGFAVTYRKMAFSFTNWLKGVSYVTYKLAIDKILNKIFGNYWVIYKQKVAWKRADRAIETLNRTNSQFKNEVKVNSITKEVY